MSGLNNIENLKDGKIRKDLLNCSAVILMHVTRGNTCSDKSSISFHLTWLVFRIFL